MKNQAGKERRFWTGARVALACAAFGGVALVASNCKSNDTANLTAKKPTVTVSSKQGGQQQPSQPQQRPQLETVPPAAWHTEIQAVDGASFRLSDFKDKVVVVDLWATWCGPCRLEVPHLVELQKEYGAKGVEVIGLTTEDPSTDEELVRNFAREFKINYRLGWSPREVSLALMNGNTTIPQTFVIAPGGRIIRKFRGFSNQIPPMIRAAIDEASEKTGD
jgi:thiol-disulfide isomerase/thioredoxin